MGENEDRTWLELIYNHKSKQFWFTSENMFSLSKTFQEKVKNGILELEKQNSLYVGLPQKNRQINLKGKIINPSIVSQNKAKNK